MILYSPVAWVAFGKGLTARACCEAGLIATQYEPKSRSLCK